MSNPTKIKKKTKFWLGNPSKIRLINLNEYKFLSTKKWSLFKMVLGSFNLLRLWAQFLNLVLSSPKSNSMKTTKSFSYSNYIFFIFHFFGFNLISFLFIFMFFVIFSSFLQKKKQSHSLLIRSYTFIFTLISWVKIIEISAVFWRNCWLKWYK